MRVVVAGLLPFGAWGNHRRHVPLRNVLAKPLGVIPFVSQHILTFITVCQPLGLRDVVLLSSSQDERKGLPRLSTLTWTLVLNPPRLRPRTWAAWPPFWGALPRRRGGPVQAVPAVALVRAGGSGDADVPVDFVPLDAGLAEP